MHTLQCCAAGDKLQVFAYTWQTVLSGRLIMLPHRVMVPAPNICSEVQPAQAAHAHVSSLETPKILCKTKRLQQVIHMSVAGSKLVSMCPYQVLKRPWIALEDRNRCACSS